MVARYRKRAVTIEAHQFNGLEDYLEIMKWMQASGSPLMQGYSTPDMWIQTLEGRMTARPGDWIIKGVVGEFYPCKPDIFAATYESAPADVIPITTSPLTNQCNRHIDCAAAKERARVAGKNEYIICCHDEDCEDCFGK